MTILLTDVVDAGERPTRQMLETHNRIVREQIRAHAGFEVKSRGDGFMVVFGSARRALHCAIGVQRDLAAYVDGINAYIQAALADPTKLPGEPPTKLES